MANQLQERIDKGLRGLKCDEDMFERIIEDAEKNDGEREKVTKAGHRRVLLLAAAVGAVLLVGAGIYYEAKTYQWDGTAKEDSLEYKLDEMARSVNSYAETSSSAELEELNLEDGDDSWRTIKQVTSENSGSMTQGRMLLSDYDSVSAIVMNSRDHLGLPAWIPEGYSFKEASILFYVPVDMAMIEPVQSEMADGKIRETFVLPESIIQNINSVTLFYENDQGETFMWGAGLEYNSDIGFGGDGNARTEVMEIPGYEKSLIIQNPKGNESGLDELYCYFLKETEDIPHVEASFLGTQYRYEHYEREKEKLDQWGGVEMQFNAAKSKYTAMLYTISGNSITKEEAIKIMESVIN